MDADDFNEQQLKLGAITAPHLTELAIAYQASSVDLRVDGKIGNDTLAALEAEREAPLLPAKKTPLDYARAEIGNGEDPTLGNNRGADVDRYREGDGTGIGAGGTGSWCASFASYCQVMYYGDEHLPFKATRGARQLVSRIAEAGRPCSFPEEGALISWYRLGADGVKTWKGHVGIIESYDATTDTLVTIEGNKNKRGQRYAKVDRFVYPNGLWRKKLAAIATLSARRPSHV